VERLGSHIHRPADVAEVLAEIGNEPVTARLAAGEPPRFPGADEDFFRAGNRQLFLVQLGELLSGDVLRAVFRLDAEQFQARIDQGHRHPAGDPPLAVGDFFVGQADRVGDRFFVGAGGRDLRVGGHDDFVAGQRHEHGMALDRVRKEGHGCRIGQPAAGEKLGQLVARPEVAATPELALAGHDVQLENQHGLSTRRSRPVQRSNRKPPHLLVGLACDRQGQPHSPPRRRLPRCRAASSRVVGLVLRAPFAGRRLCCGTLGALVRNRARFTPLHGAVRRR